MPIEASDIEDFNSTVEEVVKEFLGSCELEVEIERQQYSNDFTLAVVLTDGSYYRKTTIFEGSCSIPSELVNGTDDD
jgi:hypothetical protein